MRTPEKARKVISYGLIASAALAGCSSKPNEAPKPKPSAVLCQLGYQILHNPNVFSSKKSVRITPHIQTDGKPHHLNEVITVSYIHGTYPNHTRTLPGTKPFNEELLELPAGVTVNLIEQSANHSKPTIYPCEGGSIPASSTF